MVFAPPAAGDSFLRVLSIQPTGWVSFWNAHGRSHFGQEIRIGDHIVGLSVGAQRMRTPPTMSARELLNAIRSRRHMDVHICRRVPCIRMQPTPARQKRRRVGSHTPQAQMSPSQGPSSITGSASQVPETQRSATQLPETQNSGTTASGPATQLPETQNSGTTSSGPSTVTMSLPSIERLFVDEGSMEELPLQRETFQ